MTAGRHRKEQERKLDQDVVEDLPPGEDESVELKGGFIPDPNERTQHRS